MYIIQRWQHSNQKSMDRFMMFAVNGNDALAGITKKKRIRRKGRTPLILSKDKSKTFIPQLP